MHRAAKNYGFIGEGAGNLLCSAKDKKQLHNKTVSSSDVAAHYIAKKKSFAPPSEAFQ
jgi:hypothetical protein